MKRFIVFSFAVLYGTFSYSQWVEQALGVNTPLSTIYFKSYNVGFIGGHDYALFKTTDRGKTWNTVTLPSDTPFIKIIADIYFPTDKIGYAVPNLKTLDGGMTWDTIAELEAYFGGLYFIDELKGFTPNSKTIDGGKTWQRIDLVPNGSPRTDVLFINDKVGFITASYHNGIWKTSDGGNTWEVKDQGFNIREITFPSNNIGYAIGGGFEGLRKTYDQGETWEGLDVPKDFGGCISCPEINTCYSGSMTGIMKTVDGGKNWFLQDSVKISSIYCFDRFTCFAVGDSGKIYKTTNGGGVHIGEPNPKIVGILIYPNPGSNTVTIEISSVNTNDIKIKIVDILGKEIYMDEIKNYNGSYSFELDISKFSTGIYILHLQAEKDNIARKFVVD